MFGSRGTYLKFFELTIPNDLYVDWHRCFVFHRLALAAIKGGPVPRLTLPCLDIAKRLEGPSDRLGQIGR
jgi:hypothetical protein